MNHRICSFAATIAATFFTLSPAVAQQNDTESSSLQQDVQREVRPAHEAFLAGTIATTGFSNTVDVRPAPTQTLSRQMIQLIADAEMYDFIDLDGPSLTLVAGGRIGHTYNAAELGRDYYDAVLARDVGQVFGLAFDEDEEKPNLYMTATSAFGLQIVGPDDLIDGVPDRLWAGAENSEWMNGQWGGFDESGPGSIYKLNGETGQVSLFANVTLDARENTGAGLGNIAFDAAHSQLFVSDLETGMVHRIDLDGTDVEQFDHGLLGRPTQDLQPVAFDASTGIDIQDDNFNPLAPDTWNLAAPERRVSGLAVQGARLYYAVADGPSVWSVGIDAETGAFLEDPRWELTVSDDHPDLDVSDIVFTPQGAMILAQRGARDATKDYTQMVDDTEAEVLRYVYESPEDDPDTPSVWHIEPAILPVGFAEGNRAGLGGVDLGLGYDERGRFDWRNCSGTLWTTGQNLRLNDDLSDALRSGGMFRVDGVQGAPRLYPAAENTPPWFSYFVDYDGAERDDDVRGHVGDVEVLGCHGTAGSQSAGGAAGSPADLPPQYDFPPETDPDFWCTAGGANAAICLCALFPNTCFPSDPENDPPKPQCAEVVTELTCNPVTNVYELTANVTDISGAGLDQTKVEDPSSSIASLPITTPLPGAFTVDLTGLFPGQSGQLNLCAFNTAEQETGEPFSCCNATVPFQIPGEPCEEGPVQ